MRTRRYGDGECFLEVKTRDGRGRSVKNRVPHPVAAAVELREQDYVHVARTLAANGVDDDGGLLAGGLFPVASTRYERSTLYLPSSGSRLTIDRGLTWGDPAGRLLELRDLVVVETKSARSAGPVDRALWRAGYRPRALSKYGVGMTLLYPELPGNRWHRLRADLRAHLVSRLP